MTAILLALIAVAGVLKFRTVGMELRYYLWRLSKVNATSADRFRTRNALLTPLAECPKGGYESLARLMTRDDVSLDIITQSTNLLIESASASPRCGSKLPSVFVRSLWNANPDARGRIEDALVYLAKAQKVGIPKDLESWRPSAQDSAEIIDTKIKLWQGLLNSPGSNPQP